MTLLLLAACERTVPCGVDCDPALGERALCGVIPDGATAATSCLAARDVGEVCALDFCSAAASAPGAGICRDGLTCVPGGLGLGTCRVAGAGLGDRCLRDTQCADGLQCVPWTERADGSPGPHACTVGYLGEITPTRFADIFEDEVESPEDAEFFTWGVCLPFAEDGVACDPTANPAGGGCLDCRPGLTCEGATPSTPGTCRTPCTSAADCSCPVGTSGVCAPDGFCTTCLNANAPATCTVGAPGQVAGCCDVGATCNLIPGIGPLGTSATTCCRAAGVACSSPGQCCRGTTCLTTGVCGTCASIGETPMPGEACCDGATPIRDPLDPGDPTLFCPRPCDDRVGQGCGRTCDHAPGTGPTPTSGVYVCTTSGTRCVDVHSARADDARAVGQISSAMWPDHRYARTDATCDGIDDDCDETADDNFAEADCSGATVAGCGSQTFEGEEVCEAGTVTCVAEPGVDYCKYGAGATTDEWNTSFCLTPGGTGGCCDGASTTPPISEADGRECDYIGAGEDTCRPASECVVNVSGVGDRRWLCRQRPVSCTPTFCYPPDITNKDGFAGVGDMCGDAPPSAGGD